MRIEKKKHVSQMTNYEISKIQKKVGRLSVSMLIGSMSEYARNRAFEKGIDINEERLSRWLESDIIEYKTVYYKFLNKLEERVVIRSNYDKDRKSTRLNSSHVSISYAVFCLKKKI